jgi:hypothetical protein
MVLNSIQFVYWSWFSNSLYHGAMGAMQGMNLDQIYDRIADVLWDTQVAQWKFWIPVQVRMTPSAMYFILLCS